jgi:hypothetical protein
MSAVSGGLLLLGRWCQRTGLATVVNSYNSFDARARGKVQREALFFGDPQMARDHGGVVDRAGAICELVGRQFVPTCTLLKRPADEKTVWVPKPKAPLP